MCIKKWLERENVKIKKSTGLVTLIDVYKFNTENVLQLKSKEDGHPFFKKIMSCKVCKCFVLWIGKCRRTRSNDELEPIRDVFEIWN